MVIVQRNIVSLRTVILEREADLERDKQAYLHLVSRHINENPGAGEGLIFNVM